MRRFLLCLLLLAGPPMGHATPFDYRLLKLGALPERASKAQLTRQWGAPITARRARYECGSNYVDSPGHTYYLLRYPQATYVGNAAEGYELETVHFRPGGAVLHYGTATWSANATLASVQKLFGPDAVLDDKMVPGAVVLSIAVKIPHTNNLADDRLDLTFRRGRLVEYNFWSPC